MTEPPANRPYIPEPFPPFSAAEIRYRHAAVRARMRAHGIDWLLLYGAGRSAEVQYLSEWPGTREAALLFPLDGDATLLVQLYNHVPNAQRVAIASDVRWAGPNTADGVAEALLERGAERARIGLAGPVPWRMHGRLRERLRAAELVDFSDALRDLRTRKSAEEVDRLRIAARITDGAMQALEEQVRPGLREHELIAIVEGAIVGAGGTPGIHFMATTPMRAPTIGVPSQIPSARIIERGDVLITEITAEYQGYGGQIHRSYAIGEPPTAEFQRLHEAAALAYERIATVLREGATVADVLDAAEIIHDRGYTIYDDLLHGTSQLPPIIQTRRTARAPQPEEFVFREDMVVVIQPNVVTDERGTMGMQVGETVRITATGIERLHGYPMRFTTCVS